MNTAPSSLKLGFAGTPDFAVPALQRLAADYSIAAVFTQPDRPAGRGRQLHMSPVKRRALELGLTVHQPATFKSGESLELLRAANIEALIVVAYGQILPAVALSVPKRGCINVHASLLPRWRGAAPIQRALLAGDAVTGITIMRMEAGLDTGPMLSWRSVPVGGRETAKTLHDRLADVGAQLLGETLPAILEGRAQATPQIAAGVTYASKIQKSEASIDWLHSAEQISRQVRAFNPWPIAETLLGGEQLRIWEAEAIEAPALGHAVPPGGVFDASREGIDIACGAGILRVLRLQLAGRKPLSAEEFLKAQRLDGKRFGAS